MECCSEEVDSKVYQELKRRNNSADADDCRDGREDAASIDMVKRRRGRPPGSKNKPKPPRAATVAPEVATALTATPSRFSSSSGCMRAHILEIPAGHDVAAALAAFSRRHGLGICVLGGTGAVANVSLRQLSPSGFSTLTLRGRFDVLSLSATFLPPTLSAAVDGAGANELKVCLSGQQGQVLGGTVAGPLLAAGTLTAVVAAFSDPTVHQLPGEQEEGGSGGIDAMAEAEPRQDEDDDEEEEEENVEDMDEGQAPKHQYQQDNYLYDHHPNGSAPGGLSVYGGHFHSDVLWQSSTSPPY